jgi:AGZA family xanthine/uracil permease-like MFS transporter
MSETQKVAGRPSAAPPAANSVDRYFRISERGSTLGREIRGGFATFFTMAYILVLNPIILGSAKDKFGHQLDTGQLVTATALVACVMTIIMGVGGNLPLAIAAGLGLNAVVAFQLAPLMSWADAMGLVVLEGILICVLVLTGLREAIMNAIPLALKQAIGVGIGLFIAFIGFVDAGFVRRLPDAANTPVPVALGAGGRLVGWPTVVFAFGLLMTAGLLARRQRGAILIGIVTTTAFAIALQAVVHVPPSVGPGGAFDPRGWNLTVPGLPHRLVAAPDFGLLGHFSLRGPVAAVGVVETALLVFTLMLADFFDTMGTVVAVGAEAGLLDESGSLPGVGPVLLVDSLAAAAGGAASASSNTTYIESAAGVAEGGRTGLASVVTGMLFLAALFLTPLVEVVPHEAASPALVVVGFLLMAQVRSVPWDDYELAIPAFLTIVLMPFTFSITNGIGAGFVSYTVIKLLRGEARDVHWMMYLASAAFVVYFGIYYVRSLLGVG